MNARCPIDDGIVIGAGPGGLALGYALAERGARCRILEAGPGAGDSWRRMPEAMRLNSGWAASALPGTPTPLYTGSRRLTRKAFHAYLQRYAQEHRLAVEPRTRVDKVERAGERLRVITNRGSFEAPWVVNATGYLANPFVPEIPGAGRSKLSRFTVPEYGSPARMRSELGSRNRVLIVGHRITAGQIAEELHDAGFAVTISHRSPIIFGWAPTLQQLGYPFFYPYERLRLRHGDYGKRDSLLPMPGGRIRRLIQGGAIATRGAIASFEATNAVRFVEGATVAFDGLIWATGYRPSLAHLEGLVTTDPDTGLPPLIGEASAEIPGLFFLGLDQQTDLTSRMLRGLRRDATNLAERLVQEGPHA